MRGLIIVISVILVALVAASFFIFSGNNPETKDDEGMPDSETDQQQETIPTDNTQTETLASQKTHSLNIQGYAYQPSTLTVNVGDTVIWTNKDGVKHTITSDSGTGNELNSPYLSTSQTYSHTFTQAGTFKYYCKPHPYMKGTIVVE